MNVQTDKAMPDDSTRGRPDSPDDNIAYHKEMEHLTMQAGDFTGAEHHRKMQEIYLAMRKAADKFLWHGNAFRE